MFEHFTFAAQAQSRQSSGQHVESESTSPTNISFPSPASPEFPFEWENQNQTTNGAQSSVDSIAQQFAIHSLSPSIEHSIASEEGQKSIWTTNTPSPIIDFDSEVCSFNPSDLSYISTTRGMSRIQADFSTPLTTTKDSLANRRLQRQRNVQLQTNAPHVRDIKSLVSGMVENNAQCQLRKSTSRPYLHSPLLSRGGGEEQGQREHDRSDRRGRERDSGGEDMDLDILCSYDRAITPDVEDEGFGDDDELIAAMKEEVASLRRTSTPSGIRKNIRRYRSSEALGVGKGGSLSGGLASNVKVVDGKVKVRCLPRMRKRCKPVLSPSMVPE